MTDNSNQVSLAGTFLPSGSMHQRLVIYLEEDYTMRPFSLLLLSALLLSLSDPAGAAPKAKRGPSIRRLNELHRHHCRYRWR